MTEPPIEIAVVQCALRGTQRHNVARVAELIREAAGRGAKIVLAPELFEGPYFPQRKNEAARSLAMSAEGHPTLETMRGLAEELGVVLPVSFYERDGDCRFNSLAMIDAGGRTLGIYRKTHIPDGPGYEEKFYFHPGDTGFQAWPTRHGLLGVGVCWDQWFPECARAMALLGAEALLYPTAIGTEPATPEEDSRDPWRRVMIGHAVANAVPVAAANRIGVEDGLTFYGGSFVCDHRGEILVELGPEEEGVGLATIDRGILKRYRANWNFLADRRPKLYGTLTDDDPR